jgi:hypothetical protein
VDAAAQSVVEKAQVSGWEEQRERGGPMGGDEVLTVFKGLGLCSG